MVMLVTIWILLIAIIVVLVVARRRIAGHEEDGLHVLDSEQDIVARQSAHVELLSRFDRWTFRLTLIIIADSLLLIARYAYVAWHQGQW